MEDQASNKLAIQRLTALSALNESGLGGLMHAFDSPFTGIVVGGIAIILISMICYLSDNKWQTIMTSLTIVLIIKAAVSPHSNITAYFAVSFQAILGAFLFSIFNSISVASILLGIISMAESAVQKVLVLFVLYGKTLWEAIDQLGDWISGKLGYLIPFSTSKALIITYVSFYALAGFITGIFISKMIQSINNNWDNPKYNLTIDPSVLKDREVSSSKKPPIKMVALVFGLLLISMMVYGYITGGWMKGVYVFGRTVILLGIWYLLIAPILLKWIQKKLKRRKSELSEEIDHVFDLMPYMKWIASKAWNESKGRGFISRIYDFVLHSLL